MKRQSKCLPAGLARALCLATLAAACGPAPDHVAAGGQGDTVVVTDQPPPAPPAGPKVALGFATELPAGDYSGQSEAAISETPSLWVVADWSGVTGDQSEQLELIAPEGSSYYAAEIPFADTNTSLVHSAALADGTRRVAFQLLIWGTTIESYDEVGTWTARATLAGGSAGGQAAVVLR